MREPGVSTHLLPARAQVRAPIPGSGGGRQRVLLPPLHRTHVLQTHGTDLVLEGGLPRAMEGMVPPPNSSMTWDPGTRSLTV